jgi:hypothetical protein
MGFTVCPIPSPFAQLLLICPSRVDEAAIAKVLAYGPFVEWMEAINHIENHNLEKPSLIVDKVHIQQIDMFGPRIGFMKFEVTFTTRYAKYLPYY